MTAAMVAKAATSGIVAWTDLRPPRRPSPRCAGPSVRPAGAVGAGPDVEPGDDDDDGMTSRMVAPAPDAAAHLPCVRVLFEDGPRVGMLAAISDDDFCDPRFWQFEEVHARQPLAKILFVRGVTLFVRDWPDAPSGVLVDEDGDAHTHRRGTAVAGSPCLFLAGSGRSS